MINLRNLIFCLAFPLFNLSCGASSEVVSNDGKDKNPKTESHHESKLEEDERKKDELLNKQADLLGEYLFGMIQRVTERLKAKEKQEVYELIQSYIDSGKDLSDPDNALELENEIKKISQKYF